MHIFIHTYINTYIHTYIHINIHAYIIPEAGQQNLHDIQAVLYNLSVRKKTAIVSYRCRHRLPNYGTSIFP